MYFQNKVDDKGAQLHYNFNKMEEAMVQHIPVLQLNYYNVRLLKIESSYYYKYLASFPCIVFRKIYYARKASKS